MDAGLRFNFQTATVSGNRVCAYILTAGYPPRTDLIDFEDGKIKAYRVKSPDDSCY